MIKASKILRRDEYGKWVKLTADEINELAGDELEGIVIKLESGESYKLVKI